MTRELAIDPTSRKQSGVLPRTDIPVHAYATPFAGMRARLGDATLKGLLRDMMILREFEQVLASFKSQGSYAGIKYLYAGPAHLAIGQEAAAVGSALALKTEDFVFGSHRGHGEFLAKGLSAIRQMDDTALEEVMQGHQSGALIKLLEGRATANSPAGRAEQFLLLGLLNEIFMKETGFNRGMGGSMHAFFPGFGIFPNNAIVGGSAPIAAGAALRRRTGGLPGITVANIGDGSSGCGPVFEAINFAAMGQLSTLWDEAHRGGLPVLFLFHNNFYAMGGQTSGETMSWDRLSRLGAGFRADNLHAETVDGTNPLAVFEAVARRRDLLENGHGPALLDVECYRYSGHSPTDVNAYRSREEIESWKAHDPIELYATKLKDNGLLTAADITALGEEIRARMADIVALSTDPDLSGTLDVKAHPLAIGEMMLSNKVELKPATLSLTANSRSLQLAKRKRHGIDPTGKKLSALSAIACRDALFEAVLDAFEREDDLIAFGEENREWGGAFGVYRGLSEVLPYHRLFNAPISEATIVGAAVGHALAGGRALVELMYADFIGRAGDEIFNQMAKWQSMSGGELKMPVVLRCSVGSKYGAQHSQDWTSLCAHIPGLKVVYPATPYDAKGLLASALAGSDPVVFFESQRLYDTVELFHEGGVPQDSYLLPIGSSDVKRTGADVTLLTIGPSLYKAMDAADVLQAEFGLSAEIIDSRSLVPFDYAPVLTSLEKTGRLLIVTEAVERGSFATTLAANIQRLGWDHLKAPVNVLGCPNWIVPGADLETTYFPQAHDIVDRVCLNLRPHPGYHKRGSRVDDVLTLARMGL